MGKFIDLSGQKFNRLIVIKREENNKDNGSMWQCSCDCGNTTSVSGYNLRSNRIKSCGCLKLEQAKIPKYKTLRYDNIRMYNIWRGIIDRCCNTNNCHFEDYGKRGIQVFEEWKESFCNFYNWAIAHGYKENLTIDRIDNDGNYEPSNCRWTTFKQQSRNRRSNHIITYNNESKTLIEWAETYNILKSTLSERLLNGWSIERALTTPSTEGKRHSSRKVICISTGKEFKSAKEAGDFYKIDRSGIGKCCRGLYSTYGKLENGTKLEWKYL